MNITFHAGHPRVAHSACLAGHFFAATVSKKVRWQENSATDVGSKIQTSGDLTLDTAQNTDNETYYRSQKKSGFSAHRPEFAVQKYGEWEAFRLAAEARREMLEAVENTPYLYHPLAKEIRERQMAKHAIKAK